MDRIIINAICFNPVIVFPVSINPANEPEPIICNVIVQEKIRQIGLFE